MFLVLNILVDFMRMLNVFCQKSNLRLILHKYIDKMNKMQYLELKGMSFYAYHGVMEQEQKVGNTYVVDLKLHVDLTQAIKTDCLDDTVNYAAVYAVVKQEMEIPSRLLEHVAGRIVGQIEQAFPEITSIEIRLAKLNPPVLGEIKEAAVSILLD
jgi:dihydroneopterin aldolase